MRIHRVECDIMGCTSFAESVEPMSKFAANMRKKGWAITREEDFCPDCAKEQAKAKKEKGAVTP